MKKTALISRRIIAFVLVVMLVVLTVPVSAATGGATVTMTDVVQYPGVYVNLGGTNYLCVADLGQPVINSGSETEMTAGTTITFDLYFYADNWYPVRVPELQGTPQELFTVKVDKIAGGDLISEPVWKTYPDDGYGERYYLEIVVVGGAEAAPLDITVTLTQPGAGADGSDNIGAAYRIQGTAAAQEMCVADFVLPSYTGPCYVGFTPAVSSASDFANLPAGATVCFPLAFLGGDGQWYAAYTTELQGTPADLFTVQETVTAGQTLLTCNGWKTWSSGQWFLEYTVAGTTEATPIQITAQLTQPALYRQSAGVTFQGTTAAKTIEKPSVPISLGGTVYDCITDFGAPDTSTGSTDLKAGDTVNFPLLWVDGSGNWYTVCYGELQGDPAELLTVVETFTAGGAVLGEPVWKYRGQYNSYYLEYTVLEAAEDQEIDFSVQLTQPDKNREGSTLSFTGTYAKNAEPVITNPTVPINLGGTVYDCFVDFGDPVTSTGKTDMLQDDTVCFPLLWVDGSGNWWTVCYGELQGDPAELFEVVETFTAGGQWFGEPVWKHDWAYNSYYLEYKILDPNAAQPLELSVQIKQSETKLGSVKTFTGTVDKRFDLFANRLTEAYPAADNQGKVILIGTSTMELWTQYASHMAPLETLNFGMGGSRVEHIADKNDLLLTPYAPQAVVVYTGGNDIMFDGQTGEEVAAEVKAYLSSVLEDLPGVPVFYVSFFTTLNDTEATEQAREYVRAELETFCGETENLYYIDAASSINSDPEKMADLLQEDGVHLNNVGYSIFGPIVAKEVCAVLNVEPENPDPKPEEELRLPLAPIKLGGTVYDCLTTFGQPVTSTGGTALSTGDTVCFPLVWMDANGVWYSVCYGELQGDPDELFTVAETVYSGGALLSDPVWKHDWQYNSYYLEYRVSGYLDSKLDFALTLMQPASDRTGEPSRFKGRFVNALLQEQTYPEYPETMVEKNVTYTRESAKRYCGATFTIAGVNYAPDHWAVELIEPRTEGGSDGTLYAGSTIIFELYYKTDAWYPVRRDEINQPPEELLEIICQFVSGEEFFTEAKWVEIDNQVGNFWGVALEAKPVEEVTEFEFSIGLTQNNGASTGSVYTCKGIISPGTPYAQVPMTAGAAMAVERLEECRIFPQTTFTLSGIKYSEKWPIDLAAPTSVDAILTDDSVIYADLMFHVGGAWYPLRKPEVNEPIEDMITFDFQILEGAECLGEPRLVTRNDGYSDIWNIEIPVNSHKEVNEFCFTIQLVTKDGQLKGSKYQVRGIVQDDEISLDVQPTEPAEDPVHPVDHSIWIWIAAGVGILAAGLVLIIIGKKRKKK